MNSPLRYLLLAPLLGLVVSVATVAAQDATRTPGTPPPEPVSYTHLDVYKRQLRSNT